jgi:phosphatidylglycerol:prolipoprotein diacylglycerol transferase
MQAIIWGIAGYKIGLLISDPDLFNNHTDEALLSLKGFWLTGILGAGIAGGLKYREFLQKKDLEEKFQDIMAGPSHYLGTILSLAFAGGIGGSKLFAMIEPNSGFWKDPIADLLSFNGLSFFGGLLVAGFLITRYLYKKGFGILTSIDGFAPSLIVAYAVGRIGCQMSGDGDWGITNLNPKPGFLSWLPDWAWAFRYPHNVAMEGLPIPGCSGEYCYQLAQPAYPTPFYETLMGLAIFGFLWAIRKRMRHPGVLTGIYLIFIGLERFLIEKIRVNELYEVLGIHFTQAELIASGLMLSGIIILIRAYRKKEPLVLPTT